MNKNLVKKWIKALRSGKYKQTSGSLHDVNGYCCLGVACKVYKDTKGITKSIRSVAGVICKNKRRDDKSEHIHNKVVAKAFGLNRISDLDYLYTQGRLASMNDLGNSFSDIADYIEENILKAS